MDGVAPLAVPTLVIGLTNKRSLIDAALLRPGRFEVQIEVPPPRTVEQRISILEVHTRHMQAAGRLLVRDAPKGTAAAKRTNDELPTYAELLQALAAETNGFSGASLAAVARAAASHALERAVAEFTHQDREGNTLLRDCVVTLKDFEKAKKDFENLGDSDFSEPESEIQEAAVSDSADVVKLETDGDEAATKNS
jgi:transitional endoplasmic reticulum ATPase